MVEGQVRLEGTRLSRLKGRPKKELPKAVFRHAFKSLEEMRDTGEEAGEGEARKG